MGLLRSFVQPGCAKVVRLASLGPMRSMLDRFSDHEAWSQIQGSLIDGCLNLLSSVTTPETQWMCLNLMHRFLCEEAESGHYEITEQSLKGLLALWQALEGGEMLIRPSLID